jgi:transposase-like protein
MTANLTDPIFNDEDKARAYFEEIRWPRGVVCPHCGNADSTRIYSIAANAKAKIRTGLRECQDCHGQFTVRTGGVMESSHLPLTKWALAYRFMSSSKKGMSAHQLHRTLGVTYKTAWFMAHRIREAMREIDPSPVGGEGKTVEADEAFIGGKEGNKHKFKRAARGGSGGKEAVFSLVERGGKVRSRHVPDVNAATLKPILVAQVSRASFLMTDEARRYTEVGAVFAGHETVGHGIGEYVRGEAHTNTIENYFSILKRGITGTYHHVSQEHLKRYLCEFDFRYNERISLGVDDTERAAKAIRGAAGKRLTYRQPRGAQ